MAKFLQETLRESGLKANAHILGSDAFKEFFRKVRHLLQFPPHPSQQEFSQGTLYG
jgi:LETM1 and EF-hand domain-containing protein 1, mitochondrial